MAVEFVFGDCILMCLTYFFWIHTGNLSSATPCTLHTENKNQHLLLL